MIEGTNPTPYVKASTRIYPHFERVSEGYTSQMPVSLEVHLTDKCNNSCGFCYYGNQLSQNTKTYPELSTKNIIDNIKTFANEGGLSVVLSGGGEPTIHEGFSEVANTIAMNNIELGVITNGIRYNYEIERALLSAKWVKYSLHASTSNQYNKITQINRPQLYNQITDNIKSFAAVREDTTISISSVVNKINCSEHDLITFYDKAISLGADYILYSPIIGETNLSIPTNEKCRREIDNAISIVKNKAENDGKFTNISNVAVGLNPTQRNIVEGSCALVESNLISCITANGDVHICLPNAANKQGNNLIIGNINHQELNQIYSGEKRREVLKQLLLSTCPPCRYEKSIKLIQDANFKNIDVLIKEAKEDNHWKFL